jgi:hypothetical protein
MMYFISVSLPVDVAGDRGLAFLQPDDERELPRRTPAKYSAWRGRLRAGRARP